MSVDVLCESSGGGWVSDERELRERLELAMREGRYETFGAAPDLTADHDEYLADRADPADVIPAALVVELLTREGPPATRPPVLRIRGAAILGELHLEYATAQIPIVLDRCRLEKVNLEQASVIDLWFTDCRISELQASQVRAAYNLALSGSRADGPVYLVGAHLGGHLLLPGAHLAGTNGPVLSADDIVAEGRVDCGALDPGDDGPWRTFKADGPVTLTGAKASYLSMAGASLKGGSGEALRASDINIARDVQLRAFIVDDDGTGHSSDVREPIPFEAKGTVDLTAAQVGGDLVLRGARLHGHGGQALLGQRMTIDGWLVCGNSMSGGQSAHFEADAGIDLLASRIHRLELTDAAFDGHLDLRSVRTGRLEDLRTRWPDELSLDGLVYEELPGLTQADSVTNRLAWVLGAAAKGGYRPRVYNQLATVYRNAGLDDVARDVLLEKQRERAKARVTGNARDSSDPDEMLRKIVQQAAGKANAEPSRFRAMVERCGRTTWEWFLDATIGYGYRPGRILWWLLGAWVIASFCFSWLEADYIDPAAKGTSRPPDFVPWLYSLDLLLPVATLGHRSLVLTYGPATYLAAAFVVAGWFFGAVLIAGLAGLFKRD